ncbi:50S ribosomal protein L34 [Microgenomates group bacterium RBG_16_45_19]|nr:MAG: 50S ribosomal protein L34 [Microgenomates group bacterium RBG_16_45_19]
MKRTYQPKKRHYQKTHGFRARQKTKPGRSVLHHRRLKSRRRLAA